MWILTTRGYGSVVVWHNPKQGELAVRGRVKSHLEYLRSLSPETAEAEIVISPKSDYRYRFFASKEAVAEIAANAVREITYSNFKSAVLARQGKTRYEDALHKVWTDLSKIQPGGPYGWGGPSYAPIPEGEPKAKSYSHFSGGTLCRGKTKKNKFCNNRALDNGYCAQHQSQAPTEKVALPKLKRTEQTVIEPLFEDDDVPGWSGISPELYESPDRELICDECGTKLEPRQALIIGNEVTCRNVTACIERVEEAKAKKPKPKKVTRRSKPTRSRSGGRRG